jgi:nucleoside-diphosphate-sugar epimerase
MKIVVTGGCGLIGHNIVQRLELNGHELRIIDTMTNYGIIPEDEIQYLMHQRMKLIQAPIHPTCITNLTIHEIFNYFKPDIVIHLASFPRQKVVNNNPQWGSAVMSQGLLNLLEASASNNVKKFVYISSSMVYGDFTDDVREDAICRPQGQYGILKLAGECLVKDYTRRYPSMSYTIIRPSAVYGPLDVEDRVVSKFMLTALREGVLKVNGSSETLDFTYVDDAADGIVAASLSDNTKNKTYNITKSHSTTLLTAAELAVAIAGRGAIECSDRDPDFPTRGALCIDAARKDFGFDPKIDVEEGFVRYHKWFTSSTYWKNKLDK